MKSQANKEIIMRTRSKRSGVTLIEMMVVVVIIALFAALVVPRLLKQGDHAKVVAAQAQINAFQTALGTYKLETSQFPSTDQGLVALRNKPGDLPNWNGPYLPKDIPNDPWGRPYLYKYPGDHGDEPDIVSYGADGQPGGEGINGDILSWTNAK
jgi:general secretion pathway protein G